MICRRHGSARRHLCPATQSKDSKPSESVPSPRPDVQTEPEYERTDIIQYESLRDKVGMPPFRSVVILKGPLIKCYLQFHGVLFTILYIKDNNIL